MTLLDLWRRREHQSEAKIPNREIGFREGLLVPATSEAIRSAKEGAEIIKANHPELTERLDAFASMGIEVPLGHIPIGVLELGSVLEVVRDARRNGPYGMDKVEFVLQIPKGEAIALKDGTAAGNGGYGPTSAIQMHNITLYQELFPPNSLERSAVELNYFAVPDDVPLQSLTTDMLQFIGTVRYNAKAEDVIGRVVRAGTYRDDKVYAHDRARANKSIRNP